MSGLKRVSIAVATILCLLLCSCLVVGCGSRESSVAEISSVDGADIEDKNFHMFVAHTTDSVSLAEKVKCNEGSTWRLFYDRLGQTEIPTKIAAGTGGELNDGDNKFFMLVTSKDGTVTNLYELTIYRGYAVNIRYYDGHELINTETVYTGETKVLSYKPMLPGYTFNCWRDSKGNVVSDGFVVEKDVALYADKTAKTYKVTYDANGGEGEIAQVVATSGESFTLPSGKELTREGYTLKEFNTVADGSGTGYKPGSIIPSYDYARDVILYAVWEYDFAYTSTEDGIIITKLNNDQYTSVVIPREIDGKSVVGIGTEAFMDKSKIQKIIIPDGVKSIGNFAFSGCYVLSDVTIPDSVTSIGNNAFVSCFKLTDIKIPNKLNTIGEYAFAYCTGIESITIPQSVTSIGGGAFYYCSKLTSVTFENADGWKLVPIYGSSKATPLDSDDLADTSTAATYLRYTYSEYYTWTRS